MRRAIVHVVPLLGLAGLLAAVFAILILGLGRPPTGAEADWLVVSTLAAAVCALVYAFARGRLTSLANRLAYGERAQPGDQLRALTGNLTRAAPIDEVLLQLVESLRRSLALDAAEIWTRSGGDLERRASDPERRPAALGLGDSEARLLSRGAVSGPAWLRIWLPDLHVGRASNDIRVAPIVESSEVLGLIVAERTSGGRPFTEEDEGVLQQLGRQLGLALRNSLLDSELRASLDQLTHRSEELRLSRARVVAASDAERNRIERDLHDGAQQHLVSLAVHVGLARDLTDTDPREAKAVLDQVAAEVHEALEQLRDLAHGIYPPLLLERGLGEALGAAVVRHDGRARVEAGGLGRYPSEVEETVYFCCLEALQNAAKHADDARVAIRIWEEEGGLLFEVADDGPGFDRSTRRPGAGLTNMSDRIGAIGGTLVVDAEQGAGTRVKGAIPLVSSA